MTTETGGAAAPEKTATWVDSTRTIRWALALVLALGSLAVFAYWLVAGEHLACQVVTVTAPGTAPRTTTTCGLPDISYFVYVLAALVILLLPDAQKLRIGGLEFERLSSQVQQQTHEIRDLRQTVTTTVNIGSDLINQTRSGFSETKDILDRVRGFLPDTAEVRSQLTAMDNLERRIDAESWPDLFSGIMTMHNLIEMAKAESRKRLADQIREAEAPQNVAQAREANTVLSDYLEDTGHADGGHP